MTLSPNRCLIVEDDRNVAWAMKQMTSARGWVARSVHTLARARAVLAEDPLPDMVLLDLHLPDGSGMELLSAIRNLCGRCHVVMVTGHASIATTVEALRLGAIDYLVKPVDGRRLDQLLARHARCIDPAGTTATAPTLPLAFAPAKPAIDPATDGFGPLIGRSQPMQRLYGAISRVAPSDASVLVTGESGTGKDVVARAIAQYSRRHDRPLLAVNCGAISPGLIESEMFGHLRGSFTGATRDHVGLFERADGGTLFLDEICEMPLELQAKLLRVLEAGAFLPVGAEESRTADVRIIAATNRSPRDAVAEGRLREDLFYRLNVFPLHMPTLRERQGDIPLLAAAFLREVSGGCGRGHRFSPEALQRLLHHPWPGNVRELRNSVVRAHVMSDGPVIGPELLLPGLERPMRSAASPAASQAAAPRARPATGSRPAPALRRLPSLAIAADIATDIAGSTPAQDGRLQIVFEIGTDLADIERQVILATLQRFDGHRERTAIALGLSPKTLYNRLREYEAPPGRRGRVPAAAAVPLPAGAGLPLGFPGLPPGGHAPGDPLPPTPAPDIPGPGDPSTPAEPPPPVQTPPSASLAAARAWTRSSPLQCGPDQCRPD